MALREVPVSASRTLDHRAYHVHPWSGGFLAASAKGQATVLSPTLEIVQRVDLGRISAVALANDGVTWAWISADVLRIGDPQGKNVAAAVPGADSCRWTSDGELWVTAVERGETAGFTHNVTIDVRDRENHVLRTVTVTDPFWGSAVAPYESYDNDSMVVWFATGQDGQQSWLFRKENTSLVHQVLPCSQDHTPPVFGPEGDWFVYAQESALVRVEWPSGQESGRLEWAKVQPDEETDDGAGNDVQLLPDGYASWNSSNGLIVIVDLDTMEIADEISLAGHPVGTVEDFYPTPHGRNDTPYSDFSFSVPGHDGSLLALYGYHELALTSARDWAPNR
ncbi:hypothetical protein GCM10009765_25400 [Fodinicola feengrottensis]|uniref:Uncharacterized protein n=1 Tax=Fodinicola feengrottensis TaxID=435914 RepID=A0ABN2GQ61_9ACTN